MPDIDPAALGRSESATNGSATPLIPVKPLPGNASSTQKTNKPAQTVPRLDIEPLYTSLKAAIGEHWARYKDAVGRFVLGSLSQEELARLTESYITVDSHREHLHNQLICGIYANSLREPPEQGVAGWVSTNDKPAVVSKPVTGDAAEQRLKLEVMQLPPRIRHRLKSIQDEPSNPLTHSILLHSQSKRVAPTTASSSHNTPATATSSTGLNTDLEVRKRYHIPLATEIRDLPPLSSITDRLAPICYEEGLASGPASPGPCIELLSTGLETFIKEIVTSIIRRSRTDAPISGPELASSLAPPITTTTSSSAIPIQPPPTTIPTLTSTVGLGPTTAASGIKTASYKKRLAAEEAAVARGELKRSETGLLPCEAASAKVHGGGSVAVQGDLRLAWEMKETWLAGWMPWLGEKIVLAEYAHFPFGADEGEDFDEAMAMRDDASAMDIDGFAGPSGALSRTISGTKTNGFLAVATAAGVNGEVRDDPMAVDEPDWGWQGAGMADRAALGSLLDDCLAIGP